jgi:hypothetical protein
MWGGISLVLMAQALLGATLTSAPAGNAGMSASSISGGGGGTDASNLRRAEVAGSIPFSELARFVEFPQYNCEFAADGNARIGMATLLASDAQRTLYDVMVYRTRAAIRMPVGTNVVTGFPYPVNGRVISVRNGWTTVAFDGRFLASIWYNRDSGDFRAVGNGAPDGIVMVALGEVADSRAALSRAMDCHEESGL